MKHLTLKICLILVSLSIIGCTGDSGDSPSLVSSISDTVKEILNPESAVNLAEKQISEIQSNLNKDKVYALTQDDVAFLKTEGLPVNENEIKSWVK